MAFFKKKRPEEEDFSLPPLPEGEELPSLPPLPGEEELPPFPEEVPQQRRMRPAGPAIPETSWQPTPTIERSAATVFVKLDKYRDIMRTVSEIDDKLAELKGTLDRISSIKSREGEIIDGWAAMLNDAKSRIDDVHSKLTKPEA